MQHCLVEELAPTRTAVYALAPRAKKLFSVKNTPSLGLFSCVRGAVLGYAVADKR